MTRRQTLGLLAVLALGLAATALAVRIALFHQTGGRLRLELGRTHLAELAPATIARLERLEEEVLVTYYASARERTPARMRGVERGVVDVLEAMRARSEGRLDYQVVDPEADPELAGFAARRRVAPFRVRTVTRDGWDERTVWSTLALSYGPRPPVLLHAVGPEHLPHLQGLLVAWLDQLERPRAPRIALAAPAGFEELATALAARGPLARARPEAGELPTADVLVWMRPGPLAPGALAALERFLARGGSVLVAGSLQHVAAIGRDAAGAPTVGFAPGAPGLAPLLARLGLRAAPGLVLDARHDSLEADGAAHAAPFLVRCIAPDQDFHTFAGQPNGTLLFAAPTPLLPDGPALRTRGARAEILATTSDATRLAATPGAPAALGSLSGAGAEVAKQPLVVALRPGDPWSGTVVALGATTPFEDGLLARGGVAHGRLLDVLLGELLSDERLVVAGAGIEPPAPLPPLGWRARAGWRSVVVFALPALLLVTAALRRMRRPGRTGGTEDGASTRRALRGAVRAAAALALVLLLARLAAPSGVRADVTLDGRNRLAPETRAIARQAGELGPVRVERVLSPEAALPPALRAAQPRLEALLDDLRRAGAKLEVVDLRPEAGSPELDARLERLEVRPFHASVQDGDVTRFRSFHASLILTRGERSLVLGFPDARAFESVEYRLAFALRRLAGARRPRVAFASDVPRLSAAEAYEDYQQQGLFAPKGTDVYRLARETLELVDLDVVHVNPRAPELPPDVDLIVWMQPRRSVGPMLAATVRHLVGGGSVLLCVQHFNVQSRQYRGADFELVYWPQPQVPDVENLWLPELSIELVREVLFDELALPIETETRITGRTGARVFEQQTSTLPFLIRASSRHFAKDSPITRDLGDQAFVWANRLRWDPARLDALGIRAQPLITTSERSWAFDWTGGWIPPEVLAGPPEAGGRPAFLGRQPLAVLFEGAFPRPEGPLHMPFAAPEEDGAADPEAPWPAPAPGRLLIVGCSEVFQDEQLLGPAFRGDQLLANAACALTLEPELVEVATRRLVVPGFGRVAPGRRLAWRATVLGAGPLALVLLAGWHALRRRRPTRRMGP